MNILITGGTGLLGTALTQLLLEKGHKVSYLSRKKQEIRNVAVYEWDLEKGYIEAGAIEQADVIVHLAGAGIADKRWTDKRKKIIIESRVKPVLLIKERLKALGKSPKAFVSASAIGYYGGDTGNAKLTEESASGTDFLAQCTTQWEAAADELAEICRVVKVRIGVVLSEKGGALPKIVAPIKFGLGAAFGTGKQWMSWIHIQDLVQIFGKAIEDEQLFGAYNATASQPVTNKDFTEIAAKTMGKPLILPNIPSVLLKFVLGEMAIVVLGSSLVANKRIAETTDFEYQFTSLPTALHDLLK